MKARAGVWLLLAALALGVLGWWSRGPSTPNSEPAAVLLTAGWREAGAEGRAVYRLPDAAPHPSAQVVPDVATLRRLVPGLRELAIHGNGIDAVGAAALGDVRVTWPDPGAAPSGPEIRAIDFPREIALGQSFRVSGRMAGLVPGTKAAVILDEPDGQPRRIEVVAEADGSAVFALVGHPTGAAGRFCWRLRVGEGGATATLGAVVRAARQPRVLLTQDAPTWELARLHEWLSQTGCDAVLRTRVSADRWRLVGGAGPQWESAVLTSVLLARFDVLVATEEALRSLGGDERAALEAAIRTAGLGLLVVGEPIAGTVATPLTPWQITPAANDAESMVRATRVRLVGGRTWPEPLEVWVATWSEHPLMRALLRDPQGDVLAALEPLGSGRVARSLVAESWRWRLTGQTADYAALWHDVLAAVARQEVPRGQWRLVPAGGVITAGQPVDVTWLGDAENAPPFARLRDGDGSEVAILRLRQLGDQPGEAAARWWPAQPGWHRLENETGQGIDLHVSPPSEWPGLERAMCRDATRELVRATAELRPAEPVTDAPNDRRQWRWGAWVVFVIALGALWWRERGAV